MSICIPQFVFQLSCADTADAHYEIHYSTAAVQTEGNCIFDILKNIFTSITWIVVLYASDVFLFSLSLFLIIVWSKSVVEGGQLCWAANFYYLLILLYYWFANKRCGDDDHDYEWLVARSSIFCCPPIRQHVPFLNASETKCHIEDL